MAERVVKMPDVGEGVAEAELVEWKVKVGDLVREDDILGAVMTDKATVEIPSPVHGEVLWLGGEVGDSIAVGAPLWSRAEGYHQLEEQSDGTTVLTFHETYHAYNPVLRFFLQRPVHAKISRDNLAVYEHALGYAGKVRRLT